MTSEIDPYSPTITLLISLSLSILFFTLFHILGPRFIPVPPRIRSLDDKIEKYEAYRRYVAIYSSALHGLACIFMLSAFVYKDGIVFDEPNKPYHYIFIGLSSGYYIVDTVASYLFNFGGATMMFHHVVMVSIFTYLFFKGRYGGLFSYLTLLGEASNPFMHVRKNAMQFENTRLFTDILGIIFCVTYIMCRVVLIGLLSTELAMSTIGLGFKLLVCLIWYFSLVWSMNVAVLLFKGLSVSFPHPWFQKTYDVLNYLETNKITRVVKHCVFMYASLAQCRHSRHTEFW